MTAANLVSILVTARYENIWFAQYHHKSGRGEHLLNPAVIYGNVLFPHPATTETLSVVDLFVVVLFGFFFKRKHDICVPITFSGTFTEQRVQASFCSVRASRSHLRTFSCEICAVFKPHRGACVEFGGADCMSVCGL